jgi:hypothetical protein
MKSLNFINIDQNRVNTVLCAIEAELGARATKNGNKPQALLLGGGRLSPTDVQELAILACRKDWDILYVAMDETQPFDALAAGDIEFSYFSTDGVSTTAVITNGKMWKRDDQSQARLVFDGANGSSEIWMKASGYFAVRDREAPPAEAGFGLAITCIQKRLEQAGPTFPVISSFGEAFIVFDMKTLDRMMNGE